MPTYIALFRGINVGGRNRLPMGELREVLAGLGLTNVRTYIQSGNVVFDSDEADTASLSGRIRAAVNSGHCFAPAVLLLTRVEFERAADANPYPQADEAPKSVHLYFLADAPEAPDLEKLNDLRTENERFMLIGKVFYLHAPDGIGRSKLAEKGERALGVTVTARNWRTVGKILEMAEG